MVEEHVVIILPTKEEYADICSNFLELFCKNWSECLFQIVVAWIGRKNGFDTVIENKKRYKKINLLECHDMSLPESIEYASKYYIADYYICMLGDAFIFQKVNDSAVRQVVEDAIFNKIVYCNLIPKPKVWLRRYQNYNGYARFINYSERYSHSYIAFLASRKFIEAEFTGGITDLDFERKYLEKANEAGKGFYSNRIILTKNIFQIVHGIEKGKWNRKAYAIIKKNNPEINLAHRKHTSIFKTFIFDIAIKIGNILPNPIRKGIKRIIMIFYKGFTTEL